MEYVHWSRTLACSSQEFAGYVWWIKWSLLEQFVLVFTFFFNAHEHKHWFLKCEQFARQTIIHPDSLTCGSDCFWGHNCDFSKCERQFRGSRPLRNDRLSRARGFFFEGWMSPLRPPFCCCVSGEAFVMSNHVYYHHFLTKNMIMLLFKFFMVFTFFVVVVAGCLDH